MTTSESSFPPVASSKIKVEEDPDPDDDVQVISPGSFAHATSAYRGRHIPRERQPLEFECSKAGNCEDESEHLDPTPDLLSSVVAVHSFSQGSFVNEVQNISTEASVVASSPSPRVKFIDWKQSIPEEGALHLETGKARAHEDLLELTLAPASCRVVAVAAPPKFTQGGSSSQEQSRKRSAGSALDLCSAEALSRLKSRVPSLPEEGTNTCPGNRSLEFICLSATDGTDCNVTNRSVRRERDALQSTGEAKRDLPCAICKGPKREETSTICGHVFCKRCIINSILLIKKCPMCQLSLKVNDVYPVHTG